MNSRNGSHSGRELMHEFNKAGAEPFKRARHSEGIIFSNAKEIGESMYHTLVTRDTTPQEGDDYLKQLQLENLRGGVVVQDGAKSPFQPSSAKPGESPFDL